VLFKKTYFVLFLFLVSCSDEASNINARHSETALPIEQPSGINIHYQMIEQEKIITDEKSPLGEWTLSVSYPEINGEIKAEVRTQINHTIAVLSNKYRCPASGEHTFSSDVKHINNKVFSMVYDVMWYCPPMPSPDSTSGALTFSLSTGENIMLGTEFVDIEASNNLSSLISNKIKAQLKENETCPVKDYFDYFYKTENSLIFVVAVEHHSDSACITNIEISKKELEAFLRPDSLLLY